MMLPRYKVNDSPQQKLNAVPSQLLLHAQYDLHIHSFRLTTHPLHIFIARNRDDHLLGSLTRLRIDSQLLVLFELFRHCLHFLPKTTSILVLF